MLVVTHLRKLYYIESTKSTLYFTFSLFILFFKNQNKNQKVCLDPGYYGG